LHQLINGKSNFKGQKRKEKNHYRNPKCTPYLQFSKHHCYGTVYHMKYC
jgi:hypothetical protein